MSLPSDELLHEAPVDESRSEEILAQEHELVEPGNEIEDEEEFEEENRDEESEEME